MKREKHTLLLWILSLFLLSYTAMAATMTIETEATTKAEIVSKKATTIAETTQKKPSEVSIDALVEAYQNAPEGEAYKIMNQIKQQIALMTRQRQVHAIDKVYQAVDQTEPTPKVIKQKKRAATKKQKKSIEKKRKKIYKKHRKKHPKKRKKDTKTSYTEAHPDPMSVFNSASGSSSIGSSSIGGDIGGDFGGDFGGGGIGGDGGMGGFR